ncbi:unnamed protein product [Penicillium discolor]
MVHTTFSTAASLLMLATTVFAACESISYTTCADKIVCDPLDCGGGRAPVKYDEPCCAAYRGTEPCVSTTSTLSCWSPSTVAASSTIASASSAETTSTSATATTDAKVSSSTGVATETSSHSISGTTTAPSTTEAPTQSTRSGTSGTGSADSSDPATPVSTNIAGVHAGPLMAVAGAVIGAAILI